MACAKDNKHRLNVLYINGAEYELVHGIVYYEGQEYNDHGHEFAVILTSPGINPEAEEGEGHMLWLMLVSESGDKISEGSYSFDIDQALSGTFRGLAFTDFNIQTWDASYAYLFQSGSVSISKFRKNYKLSLEATAEEMDEDGETTRTGVEVHCDFKGELIEEDFPSSILKGKEILH
jgi:hypothetical protein